MITLNFEGRKRVDSNLNIAPLIDIVFLLLIFFMLSSHFINQPGIKITLPTAKFSQNHSDDKVIIFISKDNNLFLNEENVSLDSLQSKLEDALSKSQKKNVIIKADEKINLGLAVKVMDIAKQAEAEGLIISTKIVEDEK